MLTFGAVARSRPSVRIPVPASRIRSSPLVEGELHAGRVPAVAVHLRPRGGDRASRAPDLDPHRGTSSPLFAFRGQKRIIAPEDPSSEATIGKVLDSISCSVSARRADPVHAVGRPALADRLGPRQVVQRDRLAIVVEGPVGGDPFLGAHAPRVLERAPQQGARGLVVEDHRAVLVEQEGGRRDARQQIAGQDQLQGFLGASRHLRAHSSIPRPNRHPLGAVTLGCRRMPRRAWMIAVAVVWALTVAGAAQAQSPGQVPPPIPQNPDANVPGLHRLGGDARPDPRSGRSQAPVHGAERALEPPQRRLPDRQLPVGRAARQPPRLHLGPVLPRVRLDHHRQPRSPGDHLRGAGQARAGDAPPPHAARPGGHGPAAPQPRRRTPSRTSAAAATSISTITTGR